MAHTIHDVGVASQIGLYSDAIEVQPNLRWLMTSGTPGLRQAEKVYLRTLSDRPNSLGDISSASWKKRA